MLRSSGIGNHRGFAEYPPGVFFAVDPAALSRSNPLC